MYISRYDLNKQLVELKRDFTWMKDINSQSLQSSIINLENAYNRFFKKKNGFPKFKKKSSKNSFSVPQNIIMKESKVFIPKFLEGISIIIDREYKGKIRSATVSKTPTNKYFISILCETGEIIPIKKEIKYGTSIGIDLGLKNFIVISDGTKIDNPKFLLNNEKSIKYLSRELSRRNRTSNRYNKTRLKLTRKYEKITNKRNDFLHKLSTEITNRYDTICVENLNIKGLLKNNKISKSISDASWSSFIKMLSYKSNWKGKNIIKIGRFESSSKTCNSCCCINKDLKLENREWICSVCGAVNDRDLNAARNIKDFALKKLLVERQLMDVEAGSMDEHLIIRSKKYPVYESSNFHFEMVH